MQLDVGQLFRIVFTSSVYRKVSVDMFSLDRNVDQLSTKLTDFPLAEFILAAIWCLLHINALVRLTG